MNEDRQMPPDWAESRKTHMAIAAAIHAIASGARSPEAIWEAPTQPEFELVIRAVEQAVRRCDFEPDAHGFAWGDRTINP